MAETAVSQYHCPNCNAPLQQEGYIIIEATDPQVNALLDLTINQVICPNCNFEHNLNLPLFYLDNEHELLGVYMPGVAQMDAQELSDSMRIPYEHLMMQQAKRLGVELPEPDAAAFPIGQENQYTPFSALTEQQAEELFPGYLLRPMVVDNLEVVAAIAQAVFDGMKADEVMEDMSRLQLINGVMAAPDPINRRKVLHRYEPMLNEELYEVIDTLAEQMQGEGNTEMVERLKFVRNEVVRYKNAQKAKLQKKSGVRSQKPE